MGVLGVVPWLYDCVRSLPFGVDEALGGWRADHAEGNNAYSMEARYYLSLMAIFTLEDRLFFNCFFYP